MKFNCAQCVCVFFSNFQLPIWEIRDQHTRYRVVPVPDGICSNNTSKLLAYPAG